MHVETADNHRRKNALEDEDYSGRIIQKKNLSTNVRTTIRHAEKREIRHMRSISTLPHRYAGTPI